MCLIAFSNFVETPAKKISGSMLAALPQHSNLNLLYTAYFAQEKKFHQFRTLYTFKMKELKHWQLSVSVVIVSWYVLWLQTND
jgi:hypothetical protein